MELFAGRQIRNGRELGALAGLTPTPFNSGNSRREQGITKAGNRHLVALWRYRETGALPEGAVLKPAATR